MTEEATTWPTIAAFIDTAETALTTQQHFYRQYIADGMPEDTAEILSIEAASGAFKAPRTASRFTDEEIAAVEAAVAARDCVKQGRWGCSLGAGHDGDCLKTCVNHFWRRLGEGSETCSIEPARARFGHLCGPCFGRAQSDMLQTPQLIAHIRSLVVPSMESARGPRVSGTRDAPIPLRPEPVEDADELYAQVVNWVISFARQLGIMPPPSVLPVLTAEQDAVRLPVYGWNPEAAEWLLRDAAVWYELHETRIVTTLPPLTVKAWCEDIGSIVRHYRSKYPQAERAKRKPERRPCEVCQSVAVVVEFFPTGWHVACTHCGNVVPAEQHDEAVDWAQTSIPQRLSLACDRGRHKSCASFNCTCDCHTERTAA
ncbi:hypothetical protein [Herbiconiux sp. UC225_62]|uniref:hypothetical protein n=1 Tax=Herbiconiux sp. UC225_62 TaxID=3350168 RepID=UPI0036D32A53